MKLLLIAVGIATVVYVSARPDEKYTSKYDNVDLDEILKSDRLLRNYLNCLMEKGKCTPDGQELKDNLPDALENDCVKCSEKQRKGSTKIMHYMINNKRDWWNEVEAKYDPSGNYKKKYQDQLKAEGIVL